MAPKSTLELTVGVISVGDTTSLRRCLQRLAPQITVEVEAIVPVDSTMDLAGLRTEFPMFDWRDLGVIPTVAPAGTVAAKHELFDTRAAAALNASRGKVVALLQDWGAPDPDWVRRVIEAHRAMPHAAIGGAVEHEGSGALNWAVYFLDFGRFQLPLTEGASAYLTDVNVAYKRAALEPLRELWRHKYNEVTINWRLRDRGETLWQHPAMVVRQDRGPLRVGELIDERLSWGRLFGGARSHYVGSRRWIYALIAPLIPVVLVGRVARKVFRGGRNRIEFLKAQPYLWLLAIVWTAGEWLGYVTGKPSPVETAGEP